MTPTLPKPSVCCGTGTANERPRFYPRQIITADDLTLDQEYSRQKFQRHNRFLHGWGVVCGATLDYTTKPWMIKVAAGYVLGPCGEEIVLCTDVCFDIRTRCVTAAPPGQDPCADIWQPPRSGCHGTHHDVCGHPVLSDVRLVPCASAPEAAVAPIISASPRAGRTATGSVFWIRCRNPIRATPSPRRSRRALPRPVRRIPRIPG